MKRLTLGVSGLAALVFTAGAVRMGGWAVVTVENPPEYLVAGTPTELRFMVRQHAVTVLSDLSPVVTARSGSSKIESRAARASNGGYRAELTVPRAGEWRVEIESGFGNSKGFLLPIKALDAADRLPAPLADAERGRVLFAAKGCVNCHVHRNVDLRGIMSDFGPELTTRRFAVQYLSAFLADPSIKPPDGDKPRMPKPDLRTADIAPLIAFINAESRTAGR